MDFILNESKSDTTFNVYECEIKNWRLTIIEDKVKSAYWTYARKYTDDNMGYMEVSAYTAKTLSDAEKLAEKLCDIVTWYKTPLFNN